MNPVAKHISYLLLTCRKVTVPDFGTFTAFMDQASFDRISQIFYPSKIRIRFSSKADNDLKLIKSLTRQLKISEEEATRYVDDFVKSVSRKLKTAGYCKLEGLGYLLWDSNHNLILKDIFWKKQKSPPLKSMRVG